MKKVILFFGELDDLEETYNIFKTAKNSSRWTINLKGIAVGIAAGIMSSLYRLGIDVVTEKSNSIYLYIRQNSGAIIGWVGILILCGLFISLIAKKVPLSSGSGIPQVEGYLFYDIDLSWGKIMIARFIGGITAAFCGMSVGREGPSVHIGACSAKALSPLLSKNDKTTENLLVTGGAAAGLSAAFNAPVAGVMFALEEIHRSFSPLILLTAASASITADLISKNIFGLQPVLSFVNTAPMELKHYVWILPVAVLSGLAGVLMNRSLLFFQKRLKKIPIYLRTMPAMVFCVIFGLFLPDILGSGHRLIGISDNIKLSIGFAALILLSKIFFTSLSFGSGVPGGIFMPILSVGAMAGTIMCIASYTAGFPENSVSNLVICAMAGCFAASVKAPVTTILLLTEMTGTFVNLLPISLCTFIALFISDKLRTVPIYEALLENLVDQQDGVENEDVVINHSDQLLEIPVEPYSEIDGMHIKELTLPHKSLIVCIRRGEKNVIPKGSTTIRGGDYLLFFTDMEFKNDTLTALHDLCRTKIPQA